MTAFTFNGLLEKYGINKDDVVLIWHDQKNLEKSIEKFDYVKDWDTFTAHQPNNRKNLERPLWAVFIKEELSGKVRFYKLFDNDFSGRKLESDGEYAVYKLKHNLALQEFENRILVDWKGSPNSWSLAAESNDHDISALLEQSRDELQFEGYDQVSLTWYELKIVLQRKEWQAALQNQKAVYMQTDKRNNKHYVGSATSKDGLYNRWQAYAKNGHGGNEGLKELNFDAIKENFSYSILEVFPPKVDDEEVLARESWWKELLNSRNKDFGYNKN
jgi:hypothetical protein